MLGEIRAIIWKHRWGRETRSCVCMVHPNRAKVSVFGGQMGLACYQKFPQYGPTDDLAGTGGTNKASMRDPLSYSKACL